MKTITMKTLIHTPGRSLGRILRGAVFVTALLGLGSALLGCSNPLAPANTGGIGPDQGRLTITIGEGVPAESIALAPNAARTLVPAGLDSGAFNRYEVAWSGHATEPDGSNADYTLGAPITLKTREWTITVTAYAGTGEAEKASARASATKTIESGDGNTLPLTLAPITGEGAENGAFSYSVSFPAGLDSVTVTITTTTGGAVTGGVIAASGEQLAAGTLEDTALSLPAGQYLLNIKLLKAGGALSAGKTVGLHIYPNLTTTAPAYTFTNDDLVVTYAVNFTANGGTPVPATQYVAHGEKATVPAKPVLADKTFDGWHKEAGLTTLWDFATDTVTADTTLYAKWTDVSSLPDTATPTASPNGGAFFSLPLVTLASTTGGAAIYYTTDGTAPASAAGGSTSLYSAPFTLPDWGMVKAIAVKSGYNNSGVLTTAAYTQNTRTVTGIAVTTPPDKTTYYVKEALDLAGLVVTATYDDSTTGVIPVTLANTNWDSVKTSAGAGKTVTITIEGFTATFTVTVSVLTHTVTFNSNGGSAVAPKTVTDGDPVTKPTDPTRSGYTFDGWYPTAESSTLYNFATPVTGNITLYAKWTALPVSRLPTASVTIAVKDAAEDTSITFTLTNSPAYADSDPVTPANGTRWVVQHPSGGVNGSGQLAGSTAGLTVTNLGNAITITKSGGALAAGPYCIAAIETGKTQHTSYLILTVQEVGGGSMGGGIDHTLVGGVLTITGTGPMPDFAFASATPWYADRATITSIVVSSGITRVGNVAFSDSAATTVTLPDGLLTIGSGAFTNMSALEAIVIPASVTAIGGGLGPYQTFEDCSALTAITVDGGNTVYKSIDGVLYSKDGTTLHKMPQAKTGPFIIPDGVTVLNFGSFNNIRLSAIDFPASVTTIQTNFIGPASYTPNLTEITARWATPPKSAANLNQWGFTQQGKITLHIPTGTEEAYATAGWTDFLAYVDDVTTP
ncbi:InlB B-repeat-containing protein [Treponema primitia]|uniref:InlB B-repeat-containing protein n=1 Tax=Treponema primitia TaxID=88058 RepID=UPI0002555431|nr:InlB B-repeat-containing protein [Treponema primitia]